MFKNFIITGSACKEIKNLTFQMLETLKYKEIKTP